MLAGLVAPFIVSGVLAALLVTAVTVLVVVFFMLVDVAFARWVLFLTGASILLYRWMS